MEAEAEARSHEDLLEAIAAAIVAVKETAAVAGMVASRREGVNSFADWGNCGDAKRGDGFGRRPDL